MRTRPRKLWFGVFIAALCLVPSSAKAGDGDGGTSLKVTSFPSGANVSVDGKDTGKVTPMSVHVSVGKHTVVIFVPNSGWAASTQTVNAVSGENYVGATLLPIPSA